MQIKKNKSLTNAEIVNFLSDLSKNIISNQLYKNHSDLISFAFYIRRKNIESILLRELNQNNQPIGSVLHISPSNIPINFAFSFLFGILTKNKNHVKLPSKNYEVISLLISEIDILRETYDFLNEYLLFYKLSHDDEILEDLIDKVDGCIVWGGDETVNVFKNKTLHKSPDFKSIYFNNKVSSLILNLNHSDFNNKTFENFYNDTLLMNQNACSSPSNIFVINCINSDLYLDDFFNKFDEYCVNTKKNIEPINRINKLVDSSSGFFKEPSVYKKYTNSWLATSHLNKYNKYGTYNIIKIQSLSEIKKYIRKNEQTLSYYGVDKDKISSVLIDNGIYVNRIVPLGKSLDIDYVWDGKNILNELTKIMDVR